MKHIPLAPLAVAAVLLLGVACSDDGNDANNGAVVQSRSADEPTGGATASTTDPETTEATDTTDDDGTGNVVPEEEALDVEVRHPNGVTLSLSRMAFESGDVVIDAEVVNSSRHEIVFHFGNVTGERLRLVDDAGTEYNFVEPTDDEGVIKVAAGESLDGTLAFRGPLSGRPAFDEFTLLPEAAATLDGIAEAVAYFDTAPVRVAGHTDAAGADGYNQTLSEQRARAVVDHLVAAGVDPGRITAEGFGETRPVAPNANDDGSDNPEGRARNRRVEVVLEGVVPDDIGG